ncbi:sigma 54-interacting transcriptional regulator [Desulfosporosinus sp.]|uniref:sigma-54 interaction domain-containing protein n=1 Tax=Desulfosporosinus sp. TaxID=157907 RepID=UPI0025C4EAC9|nr:sigma 54-interacting transcriptional regulator [Desulfosporosinus sp.]MBC2722984.1 sigma 54-interacting transcriptional regulator [Desulfosporosinus sp.]MBC2725227.1 sigma 54-interacting transcriptional regulator [Desulfosporosinus sp.]
MSVSKLSSPMSELKINQSYVQKIAEVIAAVIEFEVAIIDKNLEVIAGTGNYKSEIGFVYGKGSITGQIIHSGDNFILDDEPLHHDICRECNQNVICKLKSGIMSPILWNDKVIGTLSIFAFDDKQKNELLTNRDKFLDFLMKISALISSKIGENEMHARLSLMANQFSAVINSIVEGLIAIDQAGFITDINKSAEKLLNISSLEACGQHISDIFPEFSAPKVLKFGQQYAEQEIKYKNKDEISLFISTITPIKKDQHIIGLVISFRTIREMRKLAGRLIREDRKYSLDGILGTSNCMTMLKQKMQLVAGTDSTILITGESGTGKELFARAIHEESHRKNGPFIAINCGAIPETLLESELFGYEEGAFTGASRGGKPGKFELANGGTIFLDEIGDMPMHLQVKLLRVLQEVEIERIGGVKPVWVDVRIIAATNRNLEEMIKEKLFRSDLFYRLSVIPFYVPPLRERKEDLILLLHHFLDKYNLILGKQVTGFTQEVQRKMLAYPWLGNVRELENAVEYAVNIATKNVIDSSFLSSRVNDYFEHNASLSTSDNQLTLAEQEKHAIETALKKFGNTRKAKEKAADSLGMSRSTFYRKIKNLGLNTKVPNRITISN